MFTSILDSNKQEFLKKKSDLPSLSILLFLLSLVLFIESSNCNVSSICDLLHREVFSCVSFSESLSWVWKLFFLLKGMTYLTYYFWANILISIYLFSISKIYYNWELFNLSFSSCYYLITDYSLNIYSFVLNTSFISYDWWKFSLLKVYFSDYNKTFLTIYWFSLSSSSV